jgi:hypothetical protein
MSADDPAWRTFPVLREFFLQWRAARAKAPTDTFRQPFRRSWEALLEDADLISGEARREADRDARTLSSAGLLELKTVRYRPYQIERLLLPLAAESRLRALFADELPEADTPRFDPGAVDWEPELAFLPTARVSVARDDLLKLNAFFAARGIERLNVPIKERSIEIFGDEKRLDALRTTALFADGRLALEQLCCFVVAEPLGWLRGPRSEGPLIVIENASTWDSYSRWNSAHGSFSAVVYGGGNRFLDSVARLNDIFTEIGGPRRVLYFGDLDPQGLRIPQIASRRAQLQGLPAIESDSWSYARLLELGSVKAVPLVEADRLDAGEFVWLGDLAAQVQPLLNAGLRIAQEHLGGDYLSKTAQFYAELWKKDGQVP